MRCTKYNDDFTLFIQNVKIEDIDNTKKYIKELILKLKRKYYKDISGIYDVKVYSNKKIGLILDFVKEQEFDFLKDIIDLNVKVYENSKIYLEFEDIFVLDNYDYVYTTDNKYYIDVDYLKTKDFLNLTEFSNFIYGEKLEKIKKNLIQVVKTS